MSEDGQHHGAVATVGAETTTATQSADGRSVYYAVHPRGLTYAELAAVAPKEALSVWLAFKTIGRAARPTMDELPVESLAAFREPVEHIAGPIGEQCEALAARFETLGFGGRVQHGIDDTMLSTSTLLWTMAAPGVPAAARVHLRLFLAPTPPQAKLFAEFITLHEDGTCTLSSSGGPSMPPPASCRVVREVGAEPDELLEMHMAAVRGHASPPVGMGTIEDALEACERHHVMFRDQLLGRRVFRPEPAAETKTRRVLERALREAGAARVKHLDVIAEIQRRRMKRPGWRSGVALLVVSAALFLLVGFKNLTIWDVLGLMVILLIHELGHLGAMKAFGYRDVRMFFVPGFGAAVSGRHSNVAGWKRAVVALAGPLPSIVIGAIVGLLGIAMGWDWAVKSGMVFMAINGFNLLPTLPLDGGQVAHVCLFARHRVLDVIFRGLTGVALLGLYFLGGGAIVLGLAIMSLVGLPWMLRIVKATAAVRQEGLRAEEREDPTIPAKTADRIVEALGRKPGDKTPAWKLADAAISVYDSISTRPPRVLGTLSLLGLQAGGLVAALAFGVLFFAARNGGLSQFAAGARNAPALVVGPVETRTERTGASVDAKAGSWTVVAVFADERNARGAMERLGARAGQEGVGLSRFGAVVFARVPRGDDGVRGAWLAALEPKSQTSFVESAVASAAIHIEARAVDAAAAKAIAGEMSDYLSLCNAPRLAPPYGAPGPTSEQLERRQLLIRLKRALWDSAEDTEIEALSQRQKEAMRIGDEATAKALGEQMQERLVTAGLARIEAAVNALSDPVQQELGRRYLAVMREGDSDSQYPRSHQVVADLLGQLPEDTPLEQRTDAIAGWAVSRGMSVSFMNLHFADPVAGVSALVAWLERRGARGIRYEVIMEDLSDLSD